MQGSMLGTHCPRAALPNYLRQFHSNSTSCEELRLSHPSMDSPLATQLFRQLFSHRSARCLARGSQRARVPAPHAPIQRRGMASRLEGETKRESKWTPRQNAFPNERMEEFERYPMVTADQLKLRRERPRRVKMLMRDFIDGRHHPLRPLQRSIETNSSSR
jgi:hypothetical protein